MIAASGCTGRLAAVVALGYGATQGVEAALLAPTAFGKQSFTLTGKDGQVTIRCAEGDYADQDRGIVKYHFEVGAGPDSFTWTD